MYTEHDYERFDQEELLSLLTHELKNALTILFGSIQLMDRKHPELKDCRYWHILKEDSVHMQYLLSELSTYNNGTRLQISTFSLSELLEPVVLSFAASLANSRIEFSSLLPSHLPYISGDYTKLREVLLNLLQNAVDAIHEKHADSGKETLTYDKILLQVIIDDSTHKVRIQITDSGCGIPADRMKQIFYPFVSYKTNGTGLGLAIVARIIAAHQGTISVSSDQKTGTTFTIILPFS